MPGPPSFGNNLCLGARLGCEFPESKDLSLQCPQSPAQGLSPVSSHILFGEQVQDSRARLKRVAKLDTKRNPVRNELGHSSFKHVITWKQKTLKIALEREGLKTQGRLETTFPFMLPKRTTERWQFQCDPAV